MKPGYTRGIHEMKPNELEQYIEDQGPDEYELESLTEWVEAGHSIYSNPSEQYDDSGREIPYIRWIRIIRDPCHPENRKSVLNRAMDLNDEYYDPLEWAAIRKTLRDEILNYRRFLALYPGAVERYELYREENQKEGC